MLSRAIFRVSTDLQPLLSRSYAAIGPAKKALFQRHCADHRDGLFDLARKFSLNSWSAVAGALLALGGMAAALRRDRTEVPAPDAA